ncbi:3-oxoacyl-[acyl-carrier-protein] reductase, partial [Clostridium saudiense]|nr:3-oxoacyl-[acyl-carrier-protein] reductase [Clostridium saudiense]
AINYRKENEDLNSLVNELKELGVNVFTQKCDVSNGEEVDRFIKESKMSLGSIDILVNNAGITKDGLILRMKENDFDSVIDVNLKGVFNTTKAVSGIMMKQRYGKIINISSVVGLSGNAGQCNYAASKAGVIGFSKSIARELATRNVNVNVVAPGYINTDMTKDLPEKIKENIIQSIPMKKIGEPKEVANLVLFLASNLSDYITGQVISVDGGMVMN